MRVRKILCWKTSSYYPYLKLSRNVFCSLHAARNAWCFQPVRSARTESVPPVASSPSAPRQRRASSQVTSGCLWSVLIASLIEVTGYADWSILFILSFFPCLNICLSCGCNMTLGGRFGSRLRGYHQVVSMPISCRPFMHRLFRSAHHLKWHSTSRDTRDLC
jgi:hypothetical protein